MASLDDVERRVTRIEERNLRVELDKSWETSLSRKLIVSALTYAVIVSFFVFAGLPNPLYNSVVPTLAFLISTLSLPVFKRVWLNAKKK
jgi:hypothetical protein